METSADFHPAIARSETNVGIIPVFREHLIIKRNQKGKSLS